MKTGFAVFSCLSMTLICAQPCLKRVSLETEFQYQHTRLCITNIMQLFYQNHAEKEFLVCSKCKQDENPYTYFRYFLPPPFNTMQISTLEVQSGHLPSQNLIYYFRERISQVNFKQPKRMPFAQYFTQFSILSKMPCLLKCSIILPFLG